MVENNKNVSNQEQEIKGELTFDDKVVQKIVGIALERVDGLLDVDGGFFSNLSQKIVETDNVTRGVDVEVGKKQVAVDLNIVVEYGKDIPALYKEIKQVIKDQVKKMTGLDVVEVNVKVVDVKSKKQYEEDSKSLQEKASGTIDSATGKIKSSVSNGKKEVEDKISSEQRVK